MGYFGDERPDPYQYKLKKGRFSKLMVVGIAAALLLFTAATFIVALSGAYVPDALIYCFFGAALGEFWALAMVKKTKTEGEERRAVYRDFGADEEKEAEAGAGDRRDEAAETGVADEGFPAGRRL